MFKNIARAYLLVAICIVLGPSVFAQCVAPSFDTSLSVTGGGPGPRGELASGDFNGDGRLDLVVPRFITDTLSVMLAQPSGVPTVVLVTSVSRPNAVGVGDFNRDGKADLAVSHGSTTLGLAILLGDGAGGFGPPADFAASLSQPLVVADFNNDGNSDVFLGGSSTGFSQMFLGNGSGALGTPLASTLTNATRAIAVEVNNDGKLDVAIEYDGQASVWVALGDGGGHFGVPAPFSTGSALVGNLAAGDFNSDGKIDLIAARQTDGILYLLGDGAGGFSSGSAVSTGFATNTVSVGDFNGDGFADIATAGGAQATVLLGNGLATFFLTRNYALPESPANMVAGDLNGDSKTDLGIASCPSCSAAATFLFGDGMGTLKAPLVLPGITPFSLASGDWNSDGKPDLAATNISENTISVFLANSSGGFLAPTTITVGNQPRGIARGDLNNDQKLDLVTANFNSDTLSVLFGDGLGGFSTPTTLHPSGFGTHFVTIDDFNGDGNADLAASYNTSNFVSIMLGNGSGGFSAPTNFTVSNGVQQIAVSDFNGDGKPDLATAAIGGTSFLLGNGNGGFGAATTFATNQPALSVAVSDFNSDGAADIAVAVGNNNQVLVYAGNGLGSFAPPTSLTANGGPSSLAVADFNGDTNPDIAASNTSGKVSVLLGNGSGGFATAVDFVNGGAVTRSVISADLTGDGRPDLALANQGSVTNGVAIGTVTILVNSCTATPQSLPVLSIATVSRTETDSGTINANFPVTLPAPSSKTVSVSFYVVGKDATPGVDYQRVSGRLLFQPGTTSQTISVPVIGDMLDEFDEQFEVVLVFPLNAELSQLRSTGTIVDNDPPPTIAISNASATEGNLGTAPLQFSVTLSAPSGKPISASYSTFDDTALAGSDYVSTSGTLSFSPGETIKIISVLANGDSTFEDHETFSVVVTNFVNVVAVFNFPIVRGTGTILNDDAELRLSQTSYAVNEGSDFAAITVNRLGDTSIPVTVKYATSDATDVNFNCNPSTSGQITGAASRKCDYHIAAGRLRFAAGETSKQIILSIVNDVYVEPNESLTIALSSATGASLGTPSSATVTITDNDTLGQANPIDGTGFYVRMLYVDLLSREPEPAGLAGWVHRIDFCGQPGEPPPPCDRVTVGGDGFLRSAEFFDREFFVIRLYRTALGRILRYDDVGDLAYVSGFLTDADLELNKQDLVNEIMGRPEFSNIYNGLSNAQYVDTMISTAAVTLPTGVRDGWVNALNASTKTRAQIFRELSERAEVSAKYLHEAQVVSCYYGFFTRNPDGAYFTFLQRYDNGEITLGDLANAFINAAEYRQRFGP